MCVCCLNVDISFLGRVDERLSLLSAGHVNSLLVCLGWRCSSHADGPVMEMNADTGQWGTRWVTGHLLSTHGDVLCKLTT